LVTYEQETQMQHELATPTDHAFTWLDFSDPSPDELNQSAQQFDLYYTVIKDCLEPDHLPKFVSIGPVNFIITRIYNRDKDTDADTIQELSKKSPSFTIRTSSLPSTAMSSPY
jgi:magnesium transporter